MSIKKIVISPSNSRAIAFFDELDRKKAETSKKIEDRLKKLISAQKSASSAY